MTPTWIVFRGYHVDAVDWWFESLLDRSRPLIDIYFKDLLLPLLHGTGPAVTGGGCPAGSRDLSVGPDGDVYSCHLLYGHPQFHLGNLLSDDPLRQETGLPLDTMGSRRVCGMLCTLLVPTLRRSEPEMGRCVGPTATRVRAATSRGLEDRRAGVRSSRDTLKPP